MVIVKIEISRHDAILLMKAVMNESQHTSVLRDQSNKAACLRILDAIEEAIAEHDSYAREAE